MPRTDIRLLNAHGVMTDTITHAQACQLYKEELVDLICEGIGRACHVVAAQFKPGKSGWKPTQSGAYLVMQLV